VNLVTRKLTSDWVEGQKSIESWVTNGPEWLVEALIRGDLERLRKSRNHRQTRWCTEFSCFPIYLFMLLAFVSPFLAYAHIIKKRLTDISARETSSSNENEYHHPWVTMASGGSHGFQYLVSLEPHSHINDAEDTVFEADLQSVYSVSCITGAYIRQYCWSRNWTDWQSVQNHRQFQAYKRSRLRNELSRQKLIKINGIRQEHLICNYYSFFVLKSRVELQR